MNRALLQQVLDALEIGLDCAINKAEDTHDSYKGYYPERHAQVDRDVADIKATIGALKVELEKPEPEPVAYMLTTRNFGLGGETWDTTEYRDYQWEYDCVPLYTAPTEPNCKFPACHSQEYQDKLVQEILDPTDGYVQPVPDKCDRIVWRDKYYHLPI